MAGAVVTTSLKTVSVVTIVLSKCTIAPSAITITSDVLSFSCKVAVPVIVKVLAETAAPKVATAPLATLPVNNFFAAVPIASKVALVVAEAINPPSPSLVAVIAPITSDVVPPNSNIASPLPA